MRANTEERQRSDGPIIRWAEARRLPWYYTQEPPLPTRTLKVHCGCVTAYFRTGRLVRLRADAEVDLFEIMFRELTGLFALRFIPPISASEGSIPYAS